VPQLVLQEYKTELEGRIDSLNRQIANLEARLANPNYTEKAPAHLVEETRFDLSEKRAELEKVKKALESL
jgi:valyl-tRNA synthetase